MSAKIVRVDPEDSINVVLSYVKAAKVSRVILEIPEGNDLLVSRVGLKTLHDKFLEIGKEVVLVVPDKPNYVKTAKDAGFVVTTSRDRIDASLWQQAKVQVLSYQASHYRSKTPVTLKQESKQEPVEPTAKAAAPRVGQDVASQRVEAEDKGETTLKLQHSKPELTKVKLTGLDFAKVVSSGDKKGRGQAAQRPAPAPAQPEGAAQPPGVIPPSGGASLGSGSKPPAPPSGKPPLGKLASGKKPPKFIGKILKFFGIVLTLVGVIGGASAYVYYKYMPRVYVKLVVASTSVSIKDQIEAGVAHVAANLEAKQIPLIKTEVTKKGSSTIKATQRVVSGDYATGTIRVVNGSTSDVVLPSGTEFTSDNGLKFKSTSEVTVPAGGGADVPVRAEKYGDEYNLDAGHSFTIGVDNASGLVASNQTSFSGGTKREYTVVGKEDVKKGVDSLKKALFDQAEEELKDANKEDGYVFIKDSVKHELDGDPKVNPKIGSEATEAYLEISTKSSALYYHQDSLNKVAEYLLIKEYKKKLKLKDDTDVEVNNLSVKVKQIKIAKDRNSAILVIEASGQITPKIDKEAIKLKIAGKKWDQAYEILKKLPYLKKEPKMEFDPSWIPRKLWYVPVQTNRITVEVSIS